MLERNVRDSPALRAEPARGRQLDPVDLAEGRGDLGAADGDGDRLRCPC